MQIKKVRFLAAARDEFRAETKYYAAIRPELGTEFVSAIEHILSMALAFPFSGTPAPDDSRKLVVKRFPYNVVYQIVNDGVMIVAIVHHSREPNYWRGRK